MENSIKIIKSIERTHAGLGIPILFGNLCNLANVSCFFMGEVGTGKGTIIKNIRALDVKPEYDMTISTMNLTTLIKTIGDVKDEKLLWRVPEWSTLQPYHRNIFLTIGSEVITDGNFNHVSRSKDEDIGLHIVNCRLTAFVGIQPLKMGKMMNENENWESIAKDRFMKFALINPLRNDTIESKPQYQFITKLSFNEVVPIHSSLAVMKMALGGQCSDERMLIYARRLLSAYCKLEGYEVATIKAEVEFRKLFGTYLNLYNLLSFTTDIDKEEKFAVGTLRLLGLVVKLRYVTLYEILSRFKYKDVTDERFRREVLERAEILQRYKLIQIGNSPTFTISKELQTFYDWYSEISK